MLCNHGSFIDFVFAGSLLSKERPHFIAARLYFYHKWLGKMLRYLGCMPKSMFTADIENAKKGYEGVIKSLTFEGEDLLVSNICIGTGVGDYTHYCNRPTSTNDLHGMGAFLLMCTAI